MAYVSSGPDPADGTCFLCDAANEQGSEASLVVDRDQLTLTLLNRYPYSSGHLMVAPLRHAADLVSLTADEGAAVFAATQLAIRALTEAMHPGGFNIGVNQGAAAGASIEHFHLHVVPRWGGDTNFMPVIGDVKVLPEHLETTAAQLRASFNRLRQL
ncbi:MAG: adenylyltransferase [Chloroflexota bacterium]|nr:adenylyltransferase [Chloroflexota bacterium]